MNTAEIIFDIQEADRFAPAVKEFEQEQPTTIRISLQSGDIFGLLGANGAGKALLIRNLYQGMGSSGIRLDGKPCNVQCPEDSGIFFAIEQTIMPQSEQTVQEIIEKDADGRPKKTDPDTLLNDLGLWRYHGLPVHFLSCAQRTKLRLAQALLRNPRLLILEEPDAGLDPTWQHDLKMRLVEMAGNHGTAVFLSSSNPRFVISTCTRVGLLDENLHIHELDLAEMATRLPCTLYRLRLKGLLDLRRAAWLDAVILASTRDETELLVDLADQSALHGLLNKIRDMMIPLLSIETASPSAETHLTYLMLTQQTRKPLHVLQERPH